MGYTADASRSPRRTNRSWVIEESASIAGALGVRHWRITSADSSVARHGQSAQTTQKVWSNPNEHH